MKKRLLVVDDMPAVRDFITDALDAEYEVTGVNNGTEAINHLSSSTVDMVITDVAVPDIGGEELTMKIKEKRPDIPVLAVTAYGGVDSATKLVRLGGF